MARRETKNLTNIKRIAGIPVHGAFISFICVRCSKINFLFVGNKLLNPTDAYETQSWKCANCNFVHSKASPLPSKDQKNKALPFNKWDKKITKGNSLAAQRFVW